ncbi:hypothetical protein DL93DRAFT_2174246 [Clavulina sp. PMI_390]|nr:hypothetical protein DL93DRAFT_2174246 [Clavulina sp. PMI_390]
MSPPTDNLTNTSGTGTNMNTSGGGAGLVPHNSLSLSEQAAVKARESEAMQKQAVEVGKAEELEKAAMAARQRAVDHGAHPLHGHPGGVETARRGGQA